jgi:hypothetical protein
MEGPTMVRIQEGEHPGTPLCCPHAHWLEGSACIRFYTNEQCIFCPAAREMLEEVLKEHDLSAELIHEIDCDRNRVKNVNGLPTIRICDQTIEGIPTDDMLEQAIWRLRIHPCFNSLLYSS